MNRQVERHTLGTVKVIGTGQSAQLVSFNKQRTGYCIYEPHPRTLPAFQCCKSWKWSLTLGSLNVVTYFSHFPSFLSLVLGHDTLLCFGNASKLSELFLFFLKPQLRVFTVSPYHLFKLARNLHNWLLSRRETVTSCEEPNRRNKLFNQLQ